MQHRKTGPRHSGTNRAPALRGVVDPAQQSPFAGLSIDQTPPSFINAPTSLTNLAQLSGISLVPVNERQPSFSRSLNNNQIISINGQQPRVTVSANSRQHLPSSLRGGIPTANNYAQYPTIYNLETIPSIQLLNRVTADQHRLPVASASLATNANFARKQTSNSTANVSSHLPGNKKPRSRGHPSNTATPTYSNNGVQVVPVSETACLNFARNARTSFSSSNELLQSAEQLSPVDSGDNMSLMKLMAILNNPALTITPVGPSTNQSDPQTSNLGSSPWNQFIPQRDSTRSQPSTKSRALNHQQNIVSGTYQSASESTRLNQSSTSATISTFSKNVPTLNLQHNYNLPSTHTFEPDEKLHDEVQNCQLNVEHISQKLEQEKPHTVTLSWSPRNGNICDEPVQSGPECTSTALVDLASSMQDVVAAADESDCLMEDHVMEEADLVTDCLLTGPRFDLKPLENEAKRKEVVHSVFSEVNSKQTPKEPIRSTKRQLYVPRKNIASTKRVKLAMDLNEVEIKTTEQPEETHVSERHLVLSKLYEIAESVCRSRSTPEDPDDIFVDRSKRIMSRIDTDLELRRKRKFLKISQRSPEVEDEDSSDGNEFELVLGEERATINELLVMPIQLPLEEALDEQKRHYMSSVGLVSRAEKNELIVQQSEKRARQISSTLSDSECSIDMDGDVQRIVDTLVQTGGVDIALRTETDIKRSELPFIEGLNRNTSRIKMTYMNAIGLEKRSKRTTLYKVVKNQDAAANNAHESRPQNDLSNKAKALMNNHVVKPQMVATIPREVAPKITSLPTKPAPRATPTESARQNGTQPLQAVGLGAGGNAEILRKAMRIAQASCREALNRAPNKDEYMKSLGLMAS